MHSMYTCANCVYILFIICMHMQGDLHVRVVSKVLVKKGPLRIHFLKRDPNQTGNLDYCHFGDRYSVQLPCIGVRIMALALA